MDLCSAFSTYSVSGLIKTNRTTTSKPHTIKLLTYFFWCSDLNEKQLLSFSTVDLLNPSMSNFRNDPGVYADFTFGILQYTAFESRRDLNH